MFVVVARNRWRDLLWYDDTIAEKPLETLPPSRVFRGKGLVMTRSGWGWDENKPALPVAWITFKCSPYYGDHTHFDNAHFDIYYKGGLAIDSGRYDDDWGMERDPEEVRKSQFFNYYQRTIAHNTVLVYDPEEKWEMNVVNDGGQKALLIAGGLRNSPEDYDQGTFPSDGGKRGSCDWATNPGRWDTGSLLAYSGSKLFTYACGDATKSYSDTKLKSFVRQFLFIQPNVVVVFDRVVATKPEFKKTWLLHTIEEPRLLESPAFEAVSREGRLACVPVLPTKVSVTKVGGPGNEFLVGGIQYACGPNASSGRTAELFHGETPGAWRVELCPSQASAENYFLNVILLTDKASSALPEVKVFSDDAAAVTVSIAGGAGGVAQLTFAKGDRPSASLKLTRGDTVLFEGLLPDKVTVDEGRPW
jgi:heparin/heparan-sulfate lyase